MLSFISDVHHPAQAADVRSRRRRYLGPAAFVVVVAIATQLVAGSGSYLLIYVTTGLFISALFTEAVSFSVGFAGVATFGSQAFYGLAGYAVAYLGVYHQITNFVVLALVGLAVGGLVALATTVFLRGNSGFVYGMVSLAVGQALYVYFSDSSSSALGDGISGVQRGHVFGVDLNSPTAWFWTVTIVGLLCVGALWLFRISMGGRALASTRLNPDRASALGLSVVRWKALAVTISGSLCGLAGALYAIHFSAIDTSSLYWTAGAIPLLAGVLGGMRTITGPLIGAITYGAASYGLSQVTDAYELYVACGVLLVYLLAPSGIVPHAQKFGSSILNWYAVRSSTKVAR